MGTRRQARRRRRDREFAAFTAGAAGRLLHLATLLAGDPADGERLLIAALARTYADWFRLRGDDPYVRTRQELAARFGRRARRYRRPRRGLLAPLPPAQRLALVLQLYEGLPAEQTAAHLGLPPEKVRTLCLRALAAVRSTR
ncbi:RNA polymerase ECF-subfamily sigma factor [Streptantibioticus cattleyicolor NRRL 8057 = DSM 46488]|uniref:RNA polymerase ECF-subfamily sigma factor n=1 Tax=Streptantibioticus cattleyicolor (strain ATCC 35852 / DSM 46488 / JCM 4925 / NBRC 14057 / NRRL 8057) TaxID=1003195 RepID=G8WR42_STREN|nr:RNA polymerase ECF-subfamily sigma factor [Streptantibioticus cattleyicolor NRRL 8057 = DSM 46488]